MGYLPILQANGMWAVWSTFSDKFIAVNCNDTDVMGFLLEIAISSAKRELTHSWNRWQLTKAKGFNSRDWLLKEYLSASNCGVDCVKSTWLGLNTDYKIEEYVN